MAHTLPFLYSAVVRYPMGEIMKSRLIKAYIELKNSQTQNTPSVNTDKNPKLISSLKQKLHTEIISTNIVR